MSLSMQLLTPVKLWASYLQAQASGGGASLIENEGSAWWVLPCTSV